jgi:CrcB protein
MRSLFIVGFGGFIGCILRYLLTLSIQNKLVSVFPFGTLGVNIIGCLFIGLILGFGDIFKISFEWRLFLATGICGGFTTFSAFSIDTFEMLRQGQFLYSILYVSASFFFGLLSTFVGFSIPRLLL